MDVISVGWLAVIVIVIIVIVVAMQDSGRH